MRATTESDSPDLAARLQAHVSDVYTRLDRGIAVMGAATSATLPTLVANAFNYRRRLTLTPPASPSRKPPTTPPLSRSFAITRARSAASSPTACPQG